MPDNSGSCRAEHAHWAVPTDHVTCGLDAGHDGPHIDYPWATRQIRWTDADPDARVGTNGVPLPQWEAPSAS